MSTVTELLMLDTNTVSYLMREKDGAIAQNLRQHDINSICISAITEAELRYGVEKNPNATQLKHVVDAFLLTVTTLPWTSHVAQAYAQLRNSIESSGLSLGNVDLLIASHALSAKATLVTSDKDFNHLSKTITLVDWCE